MSPLIFSFPVMYAVVGFCSPRTIAMKLSSVVVIVVSASPPPSRDADGSVLHRHEPLAGSFDVEQVRVVHPGGLLGVRLARQAIEELLHALSHLVSLLGRWKRRIYPVASGRAWTST